jgi:hypothetical protein
MYLSDLTFIEEGTPNFTDNGLLNFAKMRMIAHVIREIRQFQQTPYKIERIPKAEMTDAKNASIKSTVKKHICSYDKLASG